MEDKKENELEKLDENGVENAEEKSVPNVKNKDGDKKSNEKSVKKKLLYLLATVGLSAFFCSFYYCSMTVPGMFFPIVMFSYMIALTILIISYIVYNRGFSRNGVTEDMLPSEWTYEQKLEYIENGRVRLQRSKWILIFIIAILFTFIVEALVLFVF